VFLTLESSLDGVAVLTPAEKYNRTKLICKSLAILASQASIVSFLRRYSLLEEIKEAWLVDRDVELTRSVLVNQPDEFDPRIKEIKETSEDIIQNETFLTSSSVLEAKSDNEADMPDNDEEKFTDLLGSANLESGSCFFFNLTLLINYLCE